MSNVNFTAVLVSAIAAMGVGAVWYSPLLFAKPWMKLSGRKEMTPGEGATAGYITAFIGAFITAYVLAHFIDLVGAVSAGQGAVVAAWAWAGFTGTSFLTTYTFSARPRQLWLIDSVQYLAVFVVMGLILGAWR